MRSPPQLVLVIVLAVTSLVAGLACGGDDCQTLDGATFRAVEAMDCGLGGEPCTWSVSFDGGAFDWLFSDYGDAGSYTCEGGVIEASGDHGSYAGEFDPESGALTWEGDVYVLADGAG
jgi:hypothetical protein